MLELFFQALINTVKPTVPGSKGPQGSMRRKRSDPSALEQARNSTPDEPTPEDPLLGVQAPAGKGRCWCCWEVADTPQNPLIRVCKGCKDLDLQWIHQVCVDSYLSALPVSVAVLQAGQMVQLPREEGEREHESGGANAVAGPEFTVRNKGFRCTRCDDLYNVLECPVPRIQVILNDKNLRASVLVMVVCMAVITACSISIIRESWGTGKMMLDVQCCHEIVKIRISMVSFSAFILLLSYWFGFETMTMIWTFSGGRATRKVLSVS
ncbi:hypothetical protein BC830DRAFT_1136369 [Chytriomyces sp. MP71]|nr:hypothetical protein BC830DRAFT_1136369 [Chytriomyces sp. MP71]